ncbi:hypothetical protein BDN71DRAFT_1434241 [Pleurotus eryngii]|uniref:cellulose 1,4-beta-cellobiosidase (non-reducing end) n=1 Tax=Pleurotus eryngii TaxID=5323 RepID=A0A9P6DCQ5_PLEER|nr:hypothetical protein BDN71DRAFT_1434241 [Pleurotus eryngii]
MFSWATLHVTSTVEVLSAPSRPLQLCVTVLLRRSAGLWVSPVGKDSICTTQCPYRRLRPITRDGSTLQPLLALINHYLIIYRAHFGPSRTQQSYDSITGDFCTAQKSAFGDNNYFATKGGLRQMGKSFDNGMVLVLSVWDDHAVNMLWLDSDFPTDKDVMIFSQAVSFSLQLDHSFILSRLGTR